MKINLWTKIKQSWRKTKRTFEPRRVKHYIQTKIHKLLDKTIGGFIRNRAKRWKFLKKRIVLFIFFSILYYFFIAHLWYVLYELHAHLCGVFNMAKKYELMIFFLIPYPIYVVYFVLSSIFISIYIDTHRAYRLFGCTWFYIFEQKYKGAFDMLWDVWFGDWNWSYVPCALIVYVSCTFLEFSDEDEEEEIENPEGYVSDLFHQNTESLELKVDIWTSEEAFHDDEEEGMGDYKQVYKMNDIDELDADHRTMMCEIFGNNEDNGEQFLELVIRMKKHNQKMYPNLEPYLKYGSEIDIELLHKEVVRKAREDGTIRQFQRDLIIHEATSFEDAWTRETWIMEYMPYNYAAHQWYFKYIPKLEWYLFQVIAWLKSLWYILRFGRKPDFVIGPYSMYNYAYRPINMSLYIKNLKDPGKIWEWVPFSLRWVTWYVKKILRYIWSNVRLVINPLALYNELKWDLFTYKARRNMKKLLKPGIYGPKWAYFFDKHKQDLDNVNLKKFRKKYPWKKKKTYEEWEEEQLKKEEQYHEENHW